MLHFARPSLVEYPYFAAHINAVMQPSTVSTTYSRSFTKLYPLRHTANKAGSFPKDTQ